MQLDIGKGYVIRSFRSEDLESLVRYANNRNVWLGLRDLFPHPYTVENGLAWLAKVKQDDPVSNYAIASAQEVIGGIGLGLQTDIHRLSAEVGYWLGEPFWGRGVASEAVRAFTGHAFAAYDIVRVFAYVYSNNPASARVLEKAGYELEGRLRKAVLKDGRILDALIYARLKE